MSSSIQRRHVCVLVLGDIGRSPRMQYHSLSLASHHFEVDFIGYKGSLLHKTITNNNNIKCHQMNEIPNFNNYLPKLLSYVFKVLWQSMVLFLLLLSISKPQYIVVQNPPSIPTLAIVWFICRLRGSLFVIDWHNYGFTILGLTLGNNHLLVKTCKWFEGYFGSKADYNICVTKALKNDLFERWKISATVLYDRPPAIFRPISLQEKHELLNKLKYEYIEFAASDKDNDTENIFTSYDIINDEISLKPNRPALVISSTSWTEDEDFNILFEAFEYYDSYAYRLHNLPHIICVITGKGPMKTFYQQKVEQKQFKSVKFIFPWIKAEDYPKLLACADVGVSLHKSSSDLDLPMKVVDMFGCCLPVCALQYKCINELVIHEENGLLFNSSKHLASHLRDIFENFPNESQCLSSLRNNLEKSFVNLRWDECWAQNALPIFHKS